MTLINGITAYPTQTLSVSDPNGNGDITFTLYYRSRTREWTADISFGDNFTVNGIKLVVSPNLLYQWHNNIPFGLLIQSKDGLDPLFIDDFISNGRVKMFLLTSSEVVTMQNLVISGEVMG